MLVRQLEEELRMRMRGPNMELQQQVELLLNENDHLTREVAILRETIKVNTKRTRRFVGRVFVIILLCRFPGIRTQDRHAKTDFAVQRRKH